MTSLGRRRPVAAERQGRVDSGTAALECDRVEGDVPIGNSKQLLSQKSSRNVFILPQTSATPACLDEKFHRSAAKSQDISDRRGEALPIRRTMGPSRLGLDSWRVPSRNPATDLYESTGRRLTVESRTGIPKRVQPALASAVKTVEAQRAQPSRSFWRSTDDRLFVDGFSAFRAG